MRAENVKEAAHAQPFVPFTLHLADGRSATVPGPDCVAISPKGRTVIVWTEDDRQRIIDMTMITEIQMGQRS